ncbi:hypothetical protein ACFQZZ_23080 [Nocardia sp. GCM10030253]|uniref:hypothetical protein n=1 Tax=Nocardia sp. GCM10030253 TaxID=3273404 RepID=UPI00363F7084
MTIDITSQDWVPDSCTLPTTERPIRIAEFDQFFTTSVHEAVRPQPTRLDLWLTAGAEPIGRELAARESGCCSFFAFTFDTTGTAPVMHIDVPAAHVDVLDALEARVSTAIDRSSR